MLSRSLLLVGFLILLTSIAGAQDPVVSAPSRPYLLGPGDEVTVKVVGEPDYDFVATVNEDGKIEGPFAEAIVAKCRSDREVKDEIIQQLKKEIRYPQVSLRITQQKSRSPATIYGEVRTPMQFELHRRATLVELLAMAGGPTEEAAGMVQVIRTQAPLCAADVDEASWKTAANDPTGGSTRLYSLAMVKQGSAAANPVIYPGDIVVVQRASPVYITGEVVAPQGIFLKEGGMTLSEAIAKVSGIKLEAKSKDIKVFRLKPDSKDRAVLSANYDLIRSGKEKDIVLEPYDIVQVDKAKDSFAKLALEFAAGAGKTLVTSGASGAGYRVIY